MNIYQIQPPVALRRCAVPVSLWEGMCHSSARSAVSRQSPVSSFRILLRSRAKVTLYQRQPSQCLSTTSLPQGQFLLGSSHWVSQHFLRPVSWSSPCPILLFPSVSVPCQICVEVWSLSLPNGFSPFLWFPGTDLQLGACTTNSFSVSASERTQSTCLLDPVIIPTVTLSPHPRTQRQCLLNSIYYRRPPAQCSPGMLARLIFFKQSRPFLLQNFTLCLESS